MFKITINYSEVMHLYLFSLKYKHTFLHLFICLLVYFSLQISQIVSYELNEIIVLSVIVNKSKIIVVIFFRSINYVSLNLITLWFIVKFTSSIWVKMLYTKPTLFCLSSSISSYITTSDYFKALAGLSWFPVSYGFSVKVAWKCMASSRQIRCLSARAVNQKTRETQHVAQINKLSSSPVHPQLRSDPRRYACHLTLWTERLKSHKYPQRFTASLSDGAAYSELKICDNEPRPNLTETPVAFYFPPEVHLLFQLRSLAQKIYILVFHSHLLPSYWPFRNTPCCTFKTIWVWCHNQFQ